MSTKRGSRPRAARRVALSRERVFRAAIALADKGGLEALTMRRLAERLRVEAMSLYHHVKNKDEILDGMVDAVFAGIPLPAPGDWQTAMRERAIAIRAALVRHPWSVGVLESRRHPGPATLGHHDAAIGCLRQAGFSIGMVAHALALLDSYVYGFVVEEQQLPLAPGGDAEALAGDILAGMSPRAYPHLAELAVEHVMKPGYAFADEFEFGLELILEALSRRRRS